MSVFDLSILDEFLLRQIVQKLSFRSGPKFYRSCRGAKEFVDGVNPDWLPPGSSRYHIVFHGDCSLGLLDVQTFNSKPLSIAIPYYAWFMGGAFLNGEMYVFGGFVEGSSTNVAYKLKNNLEWEQLPDMNEKRAGIAESCVVYKGCIWVMGGGTDGGRAAGTVEAYDPTSNSWITKPPMNYGRVRSSAAVVHGKIFVCGGVGGPPGVVEYFDVQLSRWIDCPRLPVWLEEKTALVLGSNLVFAGWNSLTSDVWSLDVGEANPRWTKMSSTTIDICFAAMFGGKLVAIGKRGGRESAEIFDGKTWSLGPDLQEIFLHYSQYTSISEEMARNLREKQEQLELVAQADASLNLGN